MMVDLVILNTRPTSYLQELDQRIVTAIQASHSAGTVDRPGGVFARRRDLLPADVLAMLRATARVHLECDGRPLGRVLVAAAAKDDVVTEDLASLPAPTRSRDRGPRGLLRLLSAGALETAREAVSAAVTTLWTSPPAARTGRRPPRPRRRRRTASAGSRPTATTRSWSKATACRRCPGPT